MQPCLQWLRLQIAMNSMNHMKRKSSKSQKNCVPTQQKKVTTGPLWQWNRWLHKIIDLWSVSMMLSWKIIFAFFVENVTTCINNKRMMVHCNKWKTFHFCLVQQISHSLLCLIQSNGRESVWSKRHWHVDSFTPLPQSVCDHFTKIIARKAKLSHMVCELTPVLSKIFKSGTLIPLLLLPQQCFCETLEAAKPLLSVWLPSVTNLNVWMEGWKGPTCPHAL